MADLNIAYLQQWVGREAVSEAVIAVEPANLLAATLDQTPAWQAGDVLPPAWHWLYFHEAVQTSLLGEEGHRQVGGFMPPVSLPRRMWAGGQFQFERPLRLGELARRRSTVRSVSLKEGRSGPLCFVVLEHEVTVQAGLCFREEQTLVYRAAPRSGEAVGPARPAPAEADFSRQIRPNPVLLFRYSALTFNSHRIHYDQDYCRQVEGYPDLVVHGPLIATLLLDLVRRHFPAATLTTFAYQARSPLFNPEPFTVNGRRLGQTVQLWAANPAGGLAMEGVVALVGP
jgi:3-methylfumaryl-CoA hydratase